MLAVSQTPSLCWVKEGFCCAIRLKTLTTQGAKHVAPQAHVRGRDVWRACSGASLWSAIKPSLESRPAIDIIFLQCWQSRCVLG